MEDPAQRRPWQQLMNECARAGGVFTASRAVALGLDRRALVRLVSNGTIIREAVGVYRVAGSTYGLAERVRVATIRSGGTASHGTAAALWGFDRLESTRVHITLRHRVERSLPDWVVVHTTRRSLRGATARRHGINLTHPLRTLLDLAGEPVGDQQLQDFLSFCVAQRLLTIPSVERFVAPNGPRRGVVRLRRLLAGTCEIDSVAEAKLLELLNDARIPRPSTQFAIREQGRFVARVDLAWPDLRVALELDGFRYHSDVQTFVSDRERGNRIVGCGWLLLRTTPATVRDNPHSVISDLRAAFKRAGAAA